jgi:hypothetical protein
MKKNLLLLTFVLLSIVSFSQIVIKNPNGTVYENEDTLGLPNMENIYFHVYNTSAETITYRFEVIEYILPADAIEFDICSSGTCSFVTTQEVPIQIGNNVELPAGAYEECHILYLNETSTDRAFITIKATNINNENDFAILSFDTDKLVGINEVTDNNSFSIYPNPTTDFITVTNLNTENQTIQITNSNGEIVKTAETLKNNQININISELSNGIYIITNGNKSKKFIVRR